MTDDRIVQAGSPLARLAERAGIGISYRDWQWRERTVSVDALVALLGVLGFPADSDEAIRRSLEALEREPWERLLAPVSVTTAEGEGTDITLAVPDGRDRDVFSWSLRLEGGETREGRFVPGDLPCEASREIDGEPVSRRLLRVPPLPVGYHRLRVSAAGLADDAEQTIIAAPGRCWQPGGDASPERRWGIAVQLYSLRSDRDWGIGDFSSLADLAENAAAIGIAMIGVNPLHALHPCHGGHSPYFPSHRLFLNTLYIDVPAVPEFAECAAVRERVEDLGFRKRIEALRRSELVDYPEVTAVKRSVLEDLYTDFRSRHLGGGKRAAATDRGREFRTFQTARGIDLRRFAIFETISEIQGSETPWHLWPEGLRRPDGKDIADFERRHVERIEFFEYLQWEASRQLDAAVEAGARAGMGIGLYGDLALGTAPDGAEAWAYQDCLAFGVRVGAPPDEFNQLGQDWGFPPFNPRALRERAYGPFAAALRAAMQPCGALRLDHVMGLARLYWIARGRPAADGTYVGYSFDDLLAVVRLESHRNSCRIVGEDLGTVPEGFRAHLAAFGFLSYRVMYFERANDGGFIAPEHYPAQALATVSTHDLPTLAGYWSGYDLDEKARLSLFSSAEAEEAARRGRDGDRRRLREYLTWHTGIPIGDGPGGDAYRLLATAVVKTLAKTPCQLTLIQVEDLIGVVEQANMPGTTHQHPNWRRRLPRPLPELLQDPVFDVFRDIR